MADVFDEASELESIQNALSVNAVRDRAKPQSHPDFNGTDCIECSATIPAGRLALGRIKCIECQEVEELSRKRFG